MIQYTLTLIIIALALIYAVFKAYSAIFPKKGHASVSTCAGCSGCKLKDLKDSNDCSYYKKP